MTAAERGSTQHVADRAPGGIGQWRHWRIPTKLAAVVLVPVIFAITLGVLHLKEMTEHTQIYRDAGQQIAVRDKVQPLLIGLQDERTLAAEYLTGAPAAAPQLKRQVAMVNAAMVEAPKVLAGVGLEEPATKLKYDTVRKQLAGLTPMRKKVVAKAVEPAEAVKAYSDVLSSLFSLEKAVIGGVGDPELARTAGALHEMSTAEEEVRIQRALGLAALSQGQLLPASLEELSNSRARLELRESEFAAIATPRQQADFSKAMAGPEKAERERALDSIKQAVADAGDDKFAPPLPPERWTTLSQSVSAKLTTVRTQLSNEVASRAFQLEDESSNNTGVYSVILMSSLIIAAGLMIMITRELLGSLDQLRRSALRIANRQLPQAVSRLRRGETVDTEVEAVGVHTREEVGEVARAFDEVHRQALRLAVDQASLRRGYSDSFVNVSRRSQGLLERQLRLFEQLEQNEQDPDQLSTLFQLDHLATRMRRNNENLMVLSGSDLARRFTQPAPLVDVLRAAVSEIEHYPRVIVQQSPAVQLVGYASSDMVRLVAELLDNAANFSAPTTSVTVSGHQSGDGSVTVDIVDRGIGMGESELALANQRLDSNEELDLSTSRRLGMLVVARLSSRHGIVVELHGGSDVEGVRASVLLPPELIASGDTEAHQPAPGHGPGVNGNSTQHLPTSGSNGATKRHVLDGDVGTHDFESLTNESWTPPTGATPPAAATAPAPSSPASALSRGMFDADPADPGEPDDPAGPDSLGETAAHPPADLFTPSSESAQRRSHLPEPDLTEDTEVGQIAPVEDLREPPSIFNEMATQWFQPTDQDAYYQADAPRSGFEEHEWPLNGESVDEPDNGAWALNGESVDEPDNGAWAFSTDATPSRTETAAGPDALGVTSAGLPRRNPRTPAAEPKPPTEPAKLPQRDPEALRGRLSHFQEGVREGSRPDATPGADPAPLPQRSRSTSRPTPATGSGLWDSASDGARQQAEAAANPDPADFTPAGLPRRTPKAQLAPGSVPPGENGGRHGSDRPRNADELRGRLSDFQQGVHRGRHSAPEGDPRGE